MLTVDELDSESEFSEPEDLGMPTPSSDSSEAAQETTSSGEVHQAMAHLLTFANQLNESTSQLVGNLSRFKEEAAAPDAAELAKCKKETERLKQQLSSRGEHVKLLRVEMKLIQAKLSSTEKALAKAHRPKFEPAQIGFFDPDLSVEEYGPGDVVSKGSVAFYRHVEPFLDAVTVAARTIPIATVRKHLHLCFAGSARTWHASVLSDAERNALATGDTLHGAADLLRRQWDRAAAHALPVQVDALKALEAMGLTPESIRRGALSPTQFVAAAVREARRLGIAAIYPQLMLAYMRIDPALRVWICPPDADASLSEFVRNVNLGVASYRTSQRSRNQLKG
ncbi:uncharacterized protein J3D65DRAFT_354700 [Phyllosticta citribraziliensis]|uniref:Uncharacterized protein n=1 Tax=Phyllosticta citribraziliensis TaxID=989973 RepID=A0ABR1LQP7_9PEZI